MQFITVSLALDGKRFALVRFGGVIVFWGNGEALPDVVNRDIDALASFKPGLFNPFPSELHSRI